MYFSCFSFIHKNQTKNKNISCNKKPFIVHDFFYDMLKTTCFSGNPNSVSILKPKEEMELMDSVKL